MPICAAGGWLEGTWVDAPARSRHLDGSLRQDELHQQIPSGMQLNSILEQKETKETKNSQLRRREPTLRCTRGESAILAIYVQSLGFALDSCNLCHERSVGVILRIASVRSRGADEAALFVELKPEIVSGIGDR